MIERRDPRALDAGPRAFEPVNLRLPIAPQIYERLQRAITTLAMLPSESLSEKELAAELGVSRTPVREALIRLADEGLIDILPQRGSFVAPIRVRDVEEAQFIREALEVAVIRRVAAGASEDFVAAQRANLDAQALAVRGADQHRFLELDEAFHRGFCHEAGLAKSWQVIRTVKLLMDRVRYLSLPEKGHLEVLFKQHEALLDAVSRRDPDEGAARMAAHLKEVLRTVQRLSADRPQLFG